MSTHRSKNWEDHATDARKNAQNIPFVRLEERGNMETRSSSLAAWQIEMLRSKTASTSCIVSDNKVQRPNHDGPISICRRNLPISLFKARRLAHPQSIFRIDWKSNASSENLICPDAEISEEREREKNIQLTRRVTGGEWEGDNATTNPEDIDS